MSIKLARTTVGVLLFSGIGLLVLAGCATKVPPPAGSDWSQACPDAPLSLQAGDTLRIRFAYWPELDEQEAIRPDGKISLSLIGDISAAGLTPEQLRAELLKQYADKIKNPEITVIVQALDSRRVYIGGEVRVPGVIAMPAKLTLPQAIMQSGGFLKESAKVSTVVVVRQKNGVQQSCSVDVRKMFEDPKSEQFLLEPFDIVFVPRSSIDKVDQWVEQYINKLVPRNIYATFSVNKTKTNVDDENQDVQTVVSLP